MPTGDADIAETISDIANLPSVQKAGNIDIRFMRKNNLSPLAVLNKVNYSYRGSVNTSSFLKLFQPEEEFAVTDLSFQEAAKLSMG